MRTGCCTLSSLLDISKIKSLHIDGQQIDEVHFRGEVIYVCKRVPELGLRLEARTKEDGTKQIYVMAKYLDYAHRYRYYDEDTIVSSNTYTHWIIYSNTNQIGSGVLSANKFQKRITFRAYNDDGTFEYGLAIPKTISYPATSITIRAVVGYKTDTKRRQIVYSDVLRASWNTLNENGPLKTSNVD